MVNHSHLVGKGIMNAYLGLCSIHAGEWVNKSISESSIMIREFPFLIDDSIYLIEGWFKLQTTSLKLFTDHSINTHFARTKNKDGEIATQVQCGHFSFAKHKSFVSLEKRYAQ